MTWKQGATSLCSGSSGNSILIRDKNDAIVCDVGLNGKSFATALSQLNYDPRRISGVLITHEHIDHISGLGVLQRRYGFRVYATAPTYKAIAGRLGKLDDALFSPIEAGREFVVGGFRVNPFAISHDAAAPVGFKVTMSGGKSVAICTDLGEVTENVRTSLYGSDIVFVEANYDEQLLRMGPYPYHLKQRISGKFGHLSNLDSASLIGDLIEHNTTRFVLSHLSQENNFPAQALLTVSSQLQDQNKLENEDYWMTVATRKQVSEVQVLS